jgi:hypothetical protein
MAANPWGKWPAEYLVKKEGQKPEWKELYEFFEKLPDPYAEKAKPEPEPFMAIDLSEPKNMINLSAEKGQTGPSRILIMGDSGTGKTHFIGTMPKPFVADFDRGLATLYGKDVKAVAYSKEDWQEFKNEVQRWRKGAQYDCETFALDSLTMAAEAAMFHVLKKNGRAQGQPTIADWGEAIREVKDLLDWVSTLPCNVIVSAHNQLEKDEMLGDIQYRPLIFGKDLPARLGIWFDEVYSTTVTTSLEQGKSVTKYRLMVKPDARNKMIKSRMNKDGKLFEQYEEPDFSTLKAKTQK